MLGLAQLYCLAYDHSMLCTLSFYLVDEPQDYKIMQAP